MRDTAHPSAALFQLFSIFTPLFCFCFPTGAFELMCVCIYCTSVFVRVSVCVCSPLGVIVDVLTRL